MLESDTIIAEIRFSNVNILFSIIFVTILLRTGDMLKDVMLDILGCRISMLMFEYMEVRRKWKDLQIKGFHIIFTALVQIHHAEVWKRNSR